MDGDDAVRRKTNPFSIQRISHVEEFAQMVFSQVEEEMLAAVSHSGRRYKTLTVAALLGSADVINGGQMVAQFYHRCQWNSQIRFTRWLGTSLFDFQKSTVFVLFQVEDETARGILALDARFVNLPHFASSSVDCIISFNFLHFSITFNPLFYAHVDCYGCEYWWTSQVELTVKSAAIVSRKMPSLPHLFHLDLIRRMKSIFPASSQKFF